jgi:hypothetical protein
MTAVFNTIRLILYEKFSFQYNQIQPETEFELELGMDSLRDIAQLGRAPALGAGCRRFKSYYPEIFYVL